MEKYLVLVQIGSPGDSEIWLPGSLIELDDRKAMLHLAAGNVAPLDNTKVPEKLEDATLIHKAEVG